MSDVTNVLNTGSEQFNNYDRTKLLLGGNDYVKRDYTNSTYVDVTLSAGQLMGVIAATDKVVPCTSGASDGSQLPIGVLANDVTVEAGETLFLSICVSGQIAREKVLFSGSDNMDTVVSSRRYEDRILSDTAGIILSEGDELTGFDNQ
jgi:uncharacterized cupredoxin-like copper-binding protein